MARQVAEKIWTIRFWVEQEVDPRHPDEEEALADLDKRICDLLEEGDFGYEVECYAYSGAEYHLTPKEKAEKEAMDEADRRYDEMRVKLHSKWRQEEQCMR